MLWNRALCMLKVERWTNGNWISCCIMQHNVLHYRRAYSLQLGDSRQMSLPTLFFSFKHTHTHTLTHAHMHAHAHAHCALLPSMHALLTHTDNHTAAPFGGRAGPCLQLAFTCKIRPLPSKPHLTVWYIAWECNRPLQIAYLSSQGLRVLRRT